MRYKALVLIMGLLLLAPPVKAQTDLLFDSTGLGSGSPLLFGEAASTYIQRLAQQVVPTASSFVCSAVFDVSKNGSPTDSLVVSMYEGGAQPEAGTFVTDSLVVPASSLGGTLALTTFTFRACPFFQASSTYYFVLSRTGALDDTNNYTAQVRSTGATVNARWSYVPVNGGWTQDTNSLWSSQLLGIQNISFFQQPTTTATSSSWTITCDQNSNLFTQSLCYIGAYLFAPAPETVNQFANLKDKVSSTIPFGYYFAIQDAVSSTLGVGTTSVVAFNASTSAAFSDIFSPLDTGFGVLTYFLFVWWLVHRFRKIEL